MVWGSFVLSKEGAPEPQLMAVYVSRMEQGISEGSFHSRFKERNYNSTEAISNHVSQTGKNISVSSFRSHFFSRDLMTILNRSRTLVMLVGQGRTMISFGIAAKTALGIRTFPWSVLYLMVFSHRGWWSLGSDPDRIFEAADRRRQISRKAGAFEDRLGDKEVLIKHW